MVLQKMLPGGRASRRNEFPRCMAYGRLSLRDKMHRLLGRWQLAENRHSCNWFAALVLLTSSGCGPASHAPAATAPIAVTAASPAPRTGLFTDVAARAGIDFR